MVSAVGTSTAAVERLEDIVMQHVDDEAVSETICDTLRALAAERDELTLALEATGKERDELASESPVTTSTFREMTAWMARGFDDLAYRLDQVETALVAQRETLVLRMNMDERRLFAQRLSERASQDVNRPAPGGE